MSAKSFRKVIVLSVFLVCTSAYLAQADKLQLREKLSKEVKIKLKDVTIAEALEKIGQKAGVKIVLSDEAVWKLPFGEATRLSVTLDGPLAESMKEMFNAFFMRYAVGDEEITIYPRPELEHILGRPTTKQLKLLAALYTNPIRVYFLDDVQESINAALGQQVLISPIQVQAQINDLLRQLVGEDPIYGEKPIYYAGKVVRTVIKKVREREPNEPQPTHFDLPTPVTLVQLFSQVTSGREPKYTRWYISGMELANQVPEIRVVDERDFRQAKLDQIVDISFKDERADTIIQRLANWTGMELIVHKEDPSWLEEEISVDMQNTKLGQAILNIVGVVDGQVSIDVVDNQIVVRGPIPRRIPAAQRRTSRSRGSSDKAGSDGYVGKISIPMEGGKYYIEFMLRESDLTEELKKLRAEKMKEVLGEPSKPKPTPATRPRETK